MFTLCMLVTLHMSLLFDNFKFISILKKKSFSGIVSDSKTVLVKISHLSGLI